MSDDLERATNNMLAAGCDAGAVEQFGELMQGMTARNDELQRAVADEDEAATNALLEHQLADAAKVEPLVLAIWKTAGTTH